MSWDATLTADDGTVLGDWNYTHNTSKMIYDVLNRFGCVNGGPQVPGGRWYDRLHGCTGPEGAAYLHEIIQALEADPDHYTTMNPANGWGSYEGLVKILTEMRNAVPERPCTWTACG